MQLPPGTLKVKGNAVCASVRGIPMEPCFNVDRTDPQSFRGSVSGLPFAYCDFVRRGPGTRRRSRTTLRTSQPLAIHAAAAPSGD